MKKSADSISSALSWQLFQRFATAFIQFLITTLLARLLIPDEYGIISLISVFISLSALLVDAGLGTAVIQQATLSDDEFSSVFWLQLVLGILMFLLLLFFAPIISIYYKNSLITHSLQLYSLILIPNAVSGMLSARLTRLMRFKSIMICNIIPLIFSGVIGIYLAILGAGIYSLIIQSIVNSIFTMILLFVSCKWCPKFVFLWDSVYIMLRFSIKLLIANCIEIGYKNLYSLFIPKIYGNDILGYYTYGKQIPNVIVSSINGSTNSVMFSFLSKIQNDKQSVCDNVRKTMQMSNYVIFPIMFGIAALSDSVIYFLLGSAWLPVSPYLFWFCFIHALFHVQSITFQAISAIGNSDIFLKYELIKKCIGIAVFICTISIGIEVMMVGQIALSIIYVILGIYPNIKILNYSIKQQLSDFIPYFTLSLIMFIIVKISISLLPTNATVIHSVVGVLVGISVYLFLSIITKNSSYITIYNTIKSIFKERY